MHLIPSPFLVPSQLRYPSILYRVLLFHFPQEKKPLKCDMRRRAPVDDTCNHLLFRKSRIRTSYHYDGTSPVYFRQALTNMVFSIEKP